jgi:hypothetical protein
MSMSDADVAVVPHDDFMEDFGGSDSKGDVLGKEVGLEELDIDFLKRCVFAWLTAFNSFFSGALAFLRMTKSPLPQRIHTSALLSASSIFTYLIF